MKKLAQEKEELDGEYSRLVEFVGKNVIKEVTQSQIPEHAPHNRYRDIVPFDDNFIDLERSQIEL